MRIKVLVEDTSSSPSYRSEHGLSLYIETENNKILFDTGASDLFLENAKKLGVNIDEMIWLSFLTVITITGAACRHFLKKTLKQMFIFMKRLSRITIQRNRAESLISD